MRRGKTGGSRGLTEVLGQPGEEGRALLLQDQMEARPVCGMGHAVGWRAEEAPASRARPRSHRRSPGLRAKVLEAFEGSEKGAW